jgi:predicted ester cyclase
MSTEANKAAYRRFMDEAFNGQQFDRVAEYIAADMVEHTPGLSAGAAGVRRDIEMFASAFPDMRVTIEDLIAEGDKVAARYYWSGTHQGAFADIAPTGKQVRVRGLDIWRMRDEKCVEHWNIEDNLGLMQQLGVIPTPE